MGQRQFAGRNLWDRQMRKTVKKGKMKMAQKNIRKIKALQELDWMERIYEIYEDRDFIEVIGGQGGDVAKYRVYFDENDEVEMVGVK